MVGYIDSARLNDCSGKLNALGVMLNVRFLLVKSQSELTKLFSQHWDDGQQLRLVLAYERYIIHISVMPYAYRINLPVNGIQQKVSKQLSK